MKLIDNDAYIQSTEKKKNKKQKTTNHGYSNWQGEEKSENET